METERDIRIWVRGPNATYSNLSTTCDSLGIQRFSVRDHDELALHDDERLLLVPSPELIDLGRTVALRACHRIVAIGKAINVDTGKAVAALEPPSPGETYVCELGEWPHWRKGISVRPDTEEEVGGFIEHPECLMDSECTQAALVEVKGVLGNAGIPVSLPPVRIERGTFQNWFTGLNTKSVTDRIYAEAASG